jgi:hypothetical protein
LCHTSNLRESYDRYPISLSIDELARSFHLTQGRMAFDLASDVQAKNRHFENQWLIKSLQEGGV